MTSAGWRIEVMIYIKNLVNTIDIHFNTVVGCIHQSDFIIPNKTFDNYIGTFTVII